jgi:hypothetical protein
MLINFYKVGKKVDFSQETARKSMKVAEEMGNSNTYWNLNQSKLFALLDVPSDFRDTFRIPLLLKKIKQ